MTLDKDAAEDAMRFMEERQGLELILVVKYNEKADIPELKKALSEYGRIEDHKVMLANVMMKHMQNYKSLDEVKKDGPFAIVLATKEDAERLKQDYEGCKEGPLKYVRGFDSFPTNF